MAISLLKKKKSKINAVFQLSPGLLPTTKKKTHNEKDTVSFKQIYRSHQRDENGNICYFRMIEIKMLRPKLDSVCSLSRDINASI